jgi:solute carrier family 35 protein
MLATVVVLFVAKNLKIVSFPGFTRDLPRKVSMLSSEPVHQFNIVSFQIWPLPLIFLANLVFGLGGTKRIKFVLPDVIYFPVDIHSL